MRLLHCALQLGLLSAALPSAYADSAWGFSDATVSVQTKGAGVGAGFQEKYALKACQGYFHYLNIQGD